MEISNLNVSAAATCGCGQRDNMKPTLGIFLNLGDSFRRYQESGRDIHWFNNYLKYYPNYFNKPLVFSYAREGNPFPEFITLFSNYFNLPRFLYTFLIPVFYFNKIKSCQVLRVKQMLGIWPALIAKLLWRIPIVSTYGYDYTHFARREGHWLSLPFIKLTEYLGLKFSDKIIVTNKTTQKKVSRLIPEGKTILLPNGVNLKLFCPERKPQSSTINIVSVGRLVYQKNFKNLISAVAELKTDKPINLTILGRGGLKKKLKKQAQRLGVNLKQIKSLPHDQVPKLLQSADIFVMASHHEGSPKALLEAMACGLPCVVSDKPFANFIITDNQDGILSKNDNINLAKAIQIIIDKPQLMKKLGYQSRQTIVIRFNNQEIIQREIKLLKSVCQS